MQNSTNTVSKQNMTNKLEVSDICSQWKNCFCPGLYLDGYAEYPGQVVESRADNRVKVSGVEECARQCSITTAFTCRSFDFCPLTGHCLLRHVHILDTGARVSNSSTCTHYSSESMYD